MLSVDTSFVESDSGKVSLTIRTIFYKSTTMKTLFFDRANSNLIENN